MSTDPMRLQASAPVTSPAERRDARSDAGSDGEPTAPHPKVASRRGARGQHRDDDAPEAPPARKAAGPDRRARKVRKVHRVVRHVDVWSLAKVTAMFVACAYFVSLVSGYLLWRAADRVGTIDGIEGFMEDAGGYDRFEILGDVVFRAASLIGLLLGIFAVVVVALGAVLFNLISDITGGIRMTVVDEDLIVVPARRRGPRPDASNATTTSRDGRGAGRGQ